jgi:hypothetical protein
MWLARVQTRDRDQLRDGDSGPLLTASWPKHDWIKVACAARENRDRHELFEKTR